MAHDILSGSSDFRDLFRQVSKRPGMYGVDWRYGSVEAFVMGVDAATGFELLKEFSAWLEGRYGIGATSIGWSGLVVDRVLPDLRSSNLPYADLDEEQGRLASEELFARLDEFLGLTLS